MLTIQELLAKSPYKGTLQDALEEYKHIELTEEETMEAILAAKQRKDSILKIKHVQLVAEENRKRLTQTQWTYAQTDAYMESRRAMLFKGNFSMDIHNEKVYKLLCLYFSHDINFVSYAIEMDVLNPSLDKGILLQGDYGVGKSWLMKLFGKNQRQVYWVRNAKDIANDYEKEGQYFIDQYIEKPKNAVNDKNMFYQPYSGLCIDDIGTEGVKVNYGNKKNVIGDLIEQRYDRKNTGVFLHGTTNLDGDQLTSYYGGRVASRIREIFNIIPLYGKDRRV